MHTKGGTPVAFVEFSDVRFASAALTSLQGFVLVSSDRGGIRIEYAKSKMGEVGTYLLGINRCKWQIYMETVPCHLLIQMFMLFAVTLVLLYGDYIYQWTSNRW